MSDIVLCLCGHRKELHVLGAEECQSTVPTHCTCKAWMRAVENVDTTATAETSRSLTDARCECGHKMLSHDADRCMAHMLTHDVQGQCKCIRYVQAKAHDPVSAPSHYTRFPGGVQPIHLARHLTYNLGSALAYIARAGHKGDAVEDLRKAIFHLEDEIKRVGK
jgi:hypothetical protein